jgi:murein DD-endopeptidase MepM/ murein hydrolase activator NlpD
VFESYLAPASGIAPPRDLACFDVWQVSLERSLRRRALAEQHRKAAPKTKGAAAAVSAALLVSPLLPMASASAQGRGTATSSLVTPLKRAFEGHVIRRGATGQTVAQIQRVLGVAADGVFGPITAHAVGDFQARNGLPRNGKVDARTWLALLKAAPAANAAPAPAAAAPARGAAPGTCGGVIAAPVHGTKTAGFGDGRHHQGVDLAAPVGTPVKAAACGTISFAGTQSGYGNMVCVQHSTAFSTCYAHLKDLIVAVGTPVAAGQVIGHIGMTGRTTGAHVHFETRVNGIARDPAPYLAGKKVIPGTPAATAPATPVDPAAPPTPAASTAPAAARSSTGAKRTAAKKVTKQTATTTTGGARAAVAVR